MPFSSRTVRVPIVRGLLCCLMGVCMAVTLVPTPTRAAPPPGATPATPAAAGPAENAPTPPSAAPATDDASVGDALEQGDLTTAAERATAARKAEPTPEHWHREAMILEQMGRYSEAKAAYQAELEALPKAARDERDAAKAGYIRVAETARATVPDEPKSTRRAELDRRWARSKPGKAGGADTAATPAKPAKQKIISKWYFWVTLAAITASAAAVAGIAIKASRDERRDALDTRNATLPVGAPILRF